LLLFADTVIVWSLFYCCILLLLLWFGVGFVVWPALLLVVVFWYRLIFVFVLLYACCMFFVYRGPIWVFSLKLSVKMKFYIFFLSNKRTENVVVVFVPR
jgi:hypothetical protein